MDIYLGYYVTMTYMVNLAAAFVLLICILNNDTIWPASSYLH